jgi:hypothetical protein
VWFHWQRCLIGLGLVLVVLNETSFSDADAVFSGAASAVCELASAGVAGCLATGFRESVFSKILHKFKCSLSINNLNALERSNTFGNRIVKSQEGKR